MQNPSNEERDKTERARGSQNPVLDSAASPNPTASENSTASEPAAFESMASEPAARSRREGAPFQNGAKSQNGAKPKSRVRPRRGASAREGLPTSQEKLREHPVFVFDAAHPANSNSSPARPNVITPEIATLRESDREPFFERELLRMFKARVQLVASIGLIFVPVFAAFYLWLLPATGAHIAIVQGCLFALLASFYLLVKSLRSLLVLRVLAQIGFAFFALKTAHLISIATGDSAQMGELGRAVQFVVLASFIHILLAVLLLPFTLREAFFAAFISIGALAWGLYFSLPFERIATYFAQLFVIVSTATLIITIAHLNARLRRSAFDSAFDLALQAAQMQEMSQTDILTQSFNRRYLEQALATELARASRFNHELSVLMFDLDNFKPVNDTLGHDAGDEVLRIVARAVATKMREVDSFGRFGGDEFVVVLPETGRNAAVTMANRLRASVAAQLWSECGADSLAAKITLSIGVITLAGPSWPSASEVLKSVDSLLYAAKNQGKDCIVWD